MKDAPKKQNRYEALIEEIFFEKYRKGAKELRFERADVEPTAARLGIKLPKNIGDILYSFRYRTTMPERILSTQPTGSTWIIEGIGRASYAFKLVKLNRIEPNPELVAIKVPDSTPEIIAAHAFTDEQALLARVRYNRLVDIFLGLAAYSLQNHLRTSVKGIGQIEIDEIYVGVDRHGCQFVIPVQAKGGNDKLSVVQTKQDIACAKEKFPSLICRALSVQFMSDNLIAMFELVVEDDQIRILEEKHYCLVPAEKISKEDLEVYSRRSTAARR